MRFGGKTVSFFWKSTLGLFLLFVLILAFNWIYDPTSEHLTVIGSYLAAALSGWLFAWFVSSRNSNQRGKPMR